MAATLVDRNFRRYILTKNFFISTNHSEEDKTMDTNKIEKLLTPEALQDIFPKERSDEFFDALFGDASEGSYDINLALREIRGNNLTLDLELHERPNCCLVCNLTQGLPQVFSRHPIINVNGVVNDVDKLLGETAGCKEWSLGYTEQRRKEMHVIPINITLG